jgi:hypothetical protein
MKSSETKLSIFEFAYVEGGADDMQLCAKSAPGVERKLRNVETAIAYEVLSRKSGGLGESWSQCRPNSSALFVKYTQARKRQVSFTDSAMAFMHGRRVLVRVHEP